MAGLTLSPAGLADAGAFLARLARLDPVALVRLRGLGDDRVALWGRLPWAALVTRTVAGSVPAEGTVMARMLLNRLAEGVVALPPRLDSRWRWDLPDPGDVRAVETVPAARVRELAAAAQRALRQAAADGVGGRAVGERVVRDALLDHVAIAVTDATVNKLIVERIDIPQRVVQAVVRMGFLRAVPAPQEPPVRVLASGEFVGLAAEYGVAWHRPESGTGTRPVVRLDVPK